MSGGESTLSGNELMRIESEMKGLGMLVQVAGASELQPEFVQTTEKVGGEQDFSKASLNISTPQFDSPSFNNVQPTPTSSSSSRSTPPPPAFHTNSSTPNTINFAPPAFHPATSLPTLAPSPSLNTSSSNFLPPPPQPPPSPSTSLRTRIYQNKPTIPASPKTMKTRFSKLIPLESCIPAGTILLSREEYDFVVEGGGGVGGVEKETDGWYRLEEGLLRAKERQADPPVVVGSPLEPIVVDPPPPPPPPIATPPTTPSSKKKGRGKRKSSSRPSTTTTSPLEKPRLSSSTPSLLSSILRLQSSLLLRSTFILLPSSSHVILRIYLIPEDAKELKEPEYTRGVLGRPGGGLVLSVLGAVRIGKGEWEGRVEKEEEVEMMMFEKDRRSILELYRGVRSPPDSVEEIRKLEVPNEEVRQRLERVVQFGPEGILTNLFQYQKASITKMLAREIAPQQTPHPAWLTRMDLVGKEYVVSVQGFISREPTKVLEPKAGLLADHMGSGKTCMILSLIVETVRERPSLEGESGFLDGTPSPTPVILTHLSEGFPSKLYTDERDRLRRRVPKPLLRPEEMDRIELEEYQEALKHQSWLDSLIKTFPVPSLRSLMLDLVQTSPTTPIKYQQTTEGLQSTVWEELKAAQPYYYLHPSPVQLDSRTGRRDPPLPQKILVASTTLIVVPTLLVRQWEDQIKEHVQEGILSVLVLRTTKDQFGTAQRLASHDVVLMSTARFSDAADDPQSQLRNLHWKRLVVDEGHTLSGDNRMRKLAEELRCESRWAVSGTPSTNLRAEVSEEEGFVALDSQTGGNETDYNRLGQLYSRFLRHEAFSKPEDWRQSITTPILEHRRGSERLGAIFDRTIVHNAVQRVAEERPLPPFTSRVVYVEMQEAERKTYNALLSLFALNSIQSQRVDEDYLFAPKQKKYLDELSRNLACASTFFSSDLLEGWLRESQQESMKIRMSDKPLNWTEEDRRGQIRAMEVVKEALEDEEWRQVVRTKTVQVEVTGLDDKGLVEAFDGFLPPPSGSNSTTTSTRDKPLLPLGSLVTMRRLLNDLRLESNVSPWRDEEELKEELLTGEVRRRRALVEELSEEEKAAMKSSRKRKKSGEGGSTATSSLRDWPEGSCFPKVSIGNSTSAKINWVVAEIRRHPNDKFIVFCSSLPDLLFSQLSEMMDLVGIGHVILARSAGGKDQGETVARFNKDSEKRAALVDARHGGRGLNLVMASRVVFLEPIWEPDLELQAQKRCHRLGQTKPVDLAILVVPGTYEDALLKRRSQLPSSEFATTKTPQGDSKLRALLQSQDYLEPSPSSSLPLDPVPLIIDAQPQAQSRPNIPLASPPQQQLAPVELGPAFVLPLLPPPTDQPFAKAVNVVEEGPPVKKKKRVAFVFAEDDEK